VGSFLVLRFCQNRIILRFNENAFGETAHTTGGLALQAIEGVLAEACFLLQRNGGRPADVLKLIQRGIFQVEFDIETEAAPLETLMGRYADTPMSLADACLVRLSELYADCRLFTIDSDFDRYRRNGRQIIPLLAPW